MTSEKEMDILKQSLSILMRELTPKKIYLFGSRAKKTARTGSDFDFALDCAAPDLTKKRLVKEALEKIMGLHSFDLVFLPEVDTKFRELILQKGKLLYEQK